MKLSNHTHRIALLVALLLAGSLAGAQEDAPPGAEDTIPTRRIPLPDVTELFAPDVLARSPVPCTTVLSPDAESTYSTNSWPGGVVPFEFDANMTSAMRTTANLAMLTLEPLARVDFIARNGHPSYIHFQDASFNRADSVGPNGGRNTINVSSWGTLGVVIHEVLHTLGFYHEQSRPDRDVYIQVQWGNIQSGREGNFFLVSSARTAGPYDFGSLMQYDQCSFSTCCPAGTTCSCPVGCETILTLPAYSAFQATMGQRVALSALDVHGLRSLYQESHWRFVDPDGPTPTTGLGVNPWRQLTSALVAAPIGARVFVMPSRYSARGVWDRPMALEAPIGGVILE